MILEEQPAKVAEAVKLFLQGLGKTKKILCVDHVIIEVLKFALNLDGGFQLLDLIITELKSHMTF